MRLTNPLTYKYLPFSQAMFTLVQVNGYSNKQECGFIIKYLCTAESKFFFLLENTEVFNPQSFLLLNPKFHSVKPAVSTVKSRLSVKSKVFSCQFGKLFLSNLNFPPIKPEVSSCQTRSCLTSNRVFLSNPKFPSFNLEISS